MKISSLLQLTDWNRFAPAPFSRPALTWTPGQVTCLFNSLYRDYPVGEIVLWAGRPTRADADPQREMIVDGLQRIAAVYSVLRGRKPGFLPETASANYALHFHVESEQFATFSPNMADDPHWIDLARFFEPRTPAVASTLMRLFPNSVDDPLFADIARRLSCLAGIADRSLSVRYLPSEASLHECLQFFHIVNGDGANDDVARSA